MGFFKTVGLVTTGFFAVGMIGTALETQQAVTPVATAPVEQTQQAPGWTPAFPGDSPRRPGQPATASYGNGLCWAGGSDFACKVTTRINSNGHEVHDVLDLDTGWKVTVVLWSNGQAEVISDGHVETVPYVNHGHYHETNPNGRGGLLF